MELPAIEHGTSRTSRWLRVRRLRLAFWIAVVEGLLIVFDVLGGWLALLIGAIVVLFYVVVGRTSRSDALRQGSWVAAMSQALVALIPIAAFLLGTLAIVMLALIALAALALLLADRR
ncbi:MAG TPA: hypothetical protein VK874_08515 [Gaiellaceae bacterium]|jgi:hypothetical protein|nr:hypothetical protein [Gaiellaceae bacterium]